MPDPVHQFNPSACRADFTYTITPVAVEIQDTGKGKKSVAEDLEAVLRKIELVSTSVIGALKGPSIPSNGTGKWPEFLRNTHLNETSRGCQLCFH